jgi:hypothetical protein
MEGSDPRKLSVKEHFENYVYNMKFYFDFSGVNLVSSPKDRVSLLGKVYQALSKTDLKEENLKIKRDFE